MKIVRTKGKDTNAYSVEGSTDEIERYYTKDQIRAMLIDVPKPIPKSEDVGGEWRHFHTTHGTASGNGKHERTYNFYVRDADESYKVVVLHNDGRKDRYEFGSPRNDTSLIYQLVAALNTFSLGDTLQRKELFTKTENRWWVVNDRRMKSGMDLLLKLGLIEKDTKNSQTTPVEYRRVKDTSRVEPYATGLSRFLKKPDQGTR